MTRGRLLVLASTLRGNHILFAAAHTRTAGLQAPRDASVSTVGVPELWTCTKGPRVFLWLLGI